MNEQQTKYTTILQIVGVLFIFWGILGLMDAKNYSYSGYITDGNNTITQVKDGSPAETAGMQVGDVMKSYDGISVTDSKASLKRKRTEIGQSVEILVDRSGEEQALQVTYTALPDKDSTLNIFVFIMGFIFVFLGLYVHLKKKTALTFAFAVFGVFFGFIWFTGPNINPGFLSNLVNSVTITIIMFAFVALARFILQYPLQSSFLKGGNSRWIYAPAAVIVAIIWILNFVQPDSTSSLNVTLNILFFVVIIFYFGLSLITLIGKYSKANAEERKSSGLNYMLLGAVLGLLPFLIFFTINQLSPTTILPAYDYMFLTFAFIPIFFSLALMQFQKIMKTKNMMTAIILLEGDTSNGDLVLSDKGKSYVKKNEVVTWIIHPDSGVESITAMTVKPGSTNVFTKRPSKLGNSKNWQGRIRNDVKGKTEEEYNIEWKDSNGKEYTFDPVLVINPFL